VKECIDCHVEKPLDQFPSRWDNGRPSGRCRPCWNAYQRGYAARNRAASKADQKRSREKRKAVHGTRAVPSETMLPFRHRNRAILWVLKERGGCVDCGTKDPRVLQFDHVDGAKVKDLGLLASGYASVEKLLAEVAKCVIRCANCHDIITAERGNFYSVTWHRDGLPAHLREQAVSILDSERDRTPGFHLTDDEVRQIKELLEKGMLQREVAALFQVSTRTIGQLQDTRAWQRVGGVRRERSSRGRYKLNADNVREIRSLAAQGYSDQVIAAKFGVTHYAISRIRRRLTWADVE
jgi:transposase